MSVTAVTRPDFDAERLRIARDLHDVVSYGFATISLQAGAAVSVVDQKPQQAVEALHAIKAASKEALEEMRGILGLLRQSSSAEARSAGVEELESLIETTTSAGVPTSLQVSGQVEALPAVVGRAAYRIVQEALTNVLRHAGNASATVSVESEAGSLRISVEDDGAGDSNMDQADSGSGLGLLGMRERALALGGSFEAGPRLEGGFHVTAVLPIAVDS